MFIGICLSAADYIRQVSAGVVDELTALLNTSKQLLLVDEQPTLSGYIADEREGLGDDRPRRGGRVYLFDGVNDYGVVSPHPLAGHTGDFSFCTWVNLTIAGNSGMCISSLTSNVELRFNGTTQRILVSSGIGVIASAISTNTLPLNTWVHVAATYTASTKVFRLYENSVLTVTGAAGTGTNVNFGTDMRIGVRGVTFPYPGKLRDLRIYNTIKTLAQVQAIQAGDIDTTGLVAQYHCNEEAGTISYDSSGNGHHLALTNITASTFHAVDVGVDNPADLAGFTETSGVIIPRDESDTVNDVLGNAIEFTGEAPNPGQAVGSPCLTFNGTNNYVSFSSPFDNDSGAYAISAWVYANSLASFNSGFGAGVIKSTNNVPQIGDFMLTVDNLGAISFFNWRTAATDLVGRRITAGGVITATTWHHIVVTFDGASTNKCYIDGVEVAFGAPLTSSSGWGTGHEIGRSFNSAGYYWNGRLMNVRVYHKNLSVAEVEYIYTGGRSGADPTLADLAAWAPFCERSGATAFNVADNTNNGTLTNMTTSPAGTGAWANTQDVFHYALSKGFTASDIGEALPFTDSLDLARASSQYARVNHSYGLSSWQAFTLEMWVKFDSIPTTGASYVLGTVGWSTIGGHLQVYESGGNVIFGFMRHAWFTSSTSITYNFTPTVDTWYHVAITKDGSHNGAIIINGTTVVTGNLGSSIGSFVTTYSTVGCQYGNGTFAQFADTKISLCRVWSVARTATQIADNMFTVFGAAETNMRAEYSFDDVYTDASGNAYTMTGINSPIFTADVPATVIPIEIPALADSTADAQGNAIGNPAGAHHNGGITDLDLIDGEWSYNETRTNPHFVRNDDGDGNADRFVSFGSTLSGDDLTVITTYTS